MPRDMPALATELDVTGQVKNPMHNVLSGEESEEEAEQGHGDRVICAVIAACPQNVRSEARGSKQAGSRMARSMDAGMASSSPSSPSTVATAVHLDAVRHPPCSDAGASCVLAAAARGML